MDAVKVLVTFRMEEQDHCDIALHVQHVGLKTRWQGRVLTENSSGRIITSETGLAHTRTENMSAPAQFLNMPHP
jgi:hypothetical protein